jgi:hypothetical protein
MNTIRVRAKGDAMLPVLGMRGRYVGRDKAGAIIEAGVDVPVESYYLRAIARGDIEAVKAVSEVSE